METHVEFGLLQRDGEAVTHILYVTLVLDEDEFCTMPPSEVDMDFKFDIRVDESHLSRLHDTPQFYTAHITP